MKPSKALLIAALAGGLSVLVLSIVRPKHDPILHPDSGSGMSSTNEFHAAVPGPPSSTAPPFWTRRVGTEALVLAASGATVEFVDAAGGVLGNGRLDPAGAFRGTIPSGANSLALRFAGGTAAVWRIPEARGLLPSILADRAVLRPGDRLRLCVRTEPGATYPPVLRLEPADPAVPAPPLAPSTEESAFWGVYETVIPDDAGPGTVVVADGKEALEIPLVPRFDSTEEGGASAPEAPPSGAPSLVLERRGDLWRAEGPADAETILFFADAGGRLLSHQAVAAIDGTASTALPLGDLPPSSFRVTAVAATPRGFLEASVGRPGPPTLALDDDAVLSRFLAERPVPGAPPSAPAWIHEGDSFAGAGPAPPARPGFLAREGSLSLLPGIESAVELPAGADVFWTPLPADAAGVVRIRGDGAILAEARIGGRDPGLLRTADPAPRVLLVESGAPGLKSVTFRWTTAGKAEEAPAVRGGGTVLERTLPGRGAAGSTVEYRILIRFENGSPGAEIVCPIPRGAVPAEDAASIRARAPAGTRVLTPDGAVIYRLPLRGPGETALSFRIRLSWPGRYAAPAATVHALSTGPGTGPGSGSIDARSASGFLEVL